MTRPPMLEDVYPLAPTQEGMLFHTLNDQGSGTYLGQFAFRMAAALDEDAFVRAWQAVVDRHPALRSGLSWEKVDAPLQVVRREARLAVRREDWRGRTEAGQRAALDAYLAEDRARGFDLSRAPLMRLALFRTGEAAWELVWTHHHVILDGWSLGLVYRDVLAAYEAFAAGREPRFGPAPRYRDFVGWIRARDEDAAEAFWRRALAGFAAPTPLGVGRAPAAGAPADPAQLLVRAAPATLAALASLARRARTTLGTVVQGAWALLLARYAGDDDVVFGAVTAGRPAELPGAEETVGLFVNTVPVRVRVPGAAAVLPWLEGLQREQAALREHEHAPLARVQGWSEVPRGQPLFESVLSFQNFRVDAAPGAAGRFGVQSFRAVEVDEAPLILAVSPGAEGLALNLGYHRARFTDAEAAGILRHLRRVLEAFAAAPQGRLADVSLLDAEERAQVLAASRGAAAGYPAAGVHEVIARRAAAWPDAPAAVDGARTLTYRALHAHAERLAARLRARGVGPETRVALFLERGAELAVALLAVLRAGGACVPVDPGYPADRIAYLLGDCGARLVLTHPAVAARLPAGTAAPLMAIDLDAAEWADGAGSADPVGSTASTASPGSPGSPGSAASAKAGDTVGPDALAYAIYTSGSTGRPKAAMISHRSLLCYAEAMRAELGLGPGDRFLQFASPSFDVMVEEIFPAWLSGAAVVFPTADLLESPDALLEVVAEYGVTGLELPTAFWHEWVRMLAEDGARLPEHVRFVIVGGERVLPERLRQWATLGVPLVHVFGLTETSVTSTTLRIGAGEDASAHPNLPVGRPIPNVETYVLDPSMAPVPARVPGELYVGGDGVGRGYLARPALTAERFVPHPLSSTPGARLYRTGDRVRRGEDGTIEFLGRIDTQVKVRGFRIEPAEIEAALSEHPSVAEAVVALREDAPGEKRLVAYVVPARAGEDGIPGTAALRAHLAGRLPAHLVPGAFVVLDALPRSPHGKLDRRRLPAPARDAGGGEGYEAPRTPVEETLARVWAEVLRAGRVGVHDDYFALGGDSILSIQVVSRARRAGLQLRPRDLFQHPTVARLAAVAIPAASNGNGAHPSGAAPAGEVPLTPIQRWFFAHEVPGRDHWNLSLLLEARRPVDPAQVEAALRAAAAHHDAFRLRFARGAGGEWTQAYAPGGPAVAFDRADLSGMDPALRVAEMERRCQAAQASLDLARGPLLRALWIDLGGGGARLLLVAHHLVVDGVSWRVLLDDLQAAHGQLARGEPLRLPERTTAWGSWAVRLAAHTAAGGFDGEAAYWTGAACCAAAPLPVDFPGGENTAARARDVQVALSADETRALLQEVPPVYRTQVDDALLAALARAWKAWTGEDRLRVELEGHGREELFPELDLSRTVGWFTSLYPVLLDLAGADGPGGALRAVKEQLRSVPGRGIGYGALCWLGAGGARAALAALPPAEVRFEYLGQLDGAVAGDGPFALAAEPPGAAMHPDAPRTHALVVTGGVLGGRLRLTLGYSDGLHREETVRRLADAFAAELRALVAHCRERGVGGYTPADFPLARLDQETLDRVLGKAPGIDDVYPLTPLQEGMLFHTLLEPESGMYLAQMGFDLAGEVDADLLVRAWQGVVDRHESLRAAYVADGLPRPLQVIRRRVAVPVHREDWRGLSAEEREARRRAWLADDHARGFEVGCAPLMRLALFRVRHDLHHVVWSFHQTLLDGWSVALVFRDVRALYRAARAGTATALPAPVGFRGYAAWLAARDAGAAEAWWREALRGFSAPTPVGGGTGEGAGHALVAEVLEAGETAALAAFARRHGLTLNTLLQGAWALLLSRYAGEEDVVFGTTISGRPPELAGVEEMVGLFINTIPVRAHADPAARVVPWLKALQAGAAAAREHGHVPLAQVQQWSEVPAGTPLFDALLVFENYPADEGAGEGDGWAAEVTEIVSWTNYALTLTAVPGARLSLRLKHDRARFGDAAAARLLRHLRTLLAGIAARPGARLGALELLDRAERAALAAEWDAAAAPFSDGVPLHALFEAWAARTPHAPALDFEGRTLAYAELDREANRLAHALRRRGVGPETRVAVFLEPGVEMIVAVLGILKAGGAYVPLDPASPAERLGYMLADAEASLVLSAAGVAGRLPAGGPPVLLMDEGVAAGEPEHAPAGGAGARNLAYAIYTSGSTGRPKGVLLEHRGAVNSVEAFRRIFRIGPGARVLLFAPLHFDPSVHDIFTALGGGATLVVARRDDLFPGEPLVALLERARVTHAKLTPSALAATPWAPLPALSTVGSGGEACPAAVVARWAPGRRFVNVYGPTETSVRVTAAECDDGTRTSPIGRAVDNARLYVLDGGLLPVPEEVPGELCIGGPGVARGYHGRPALTAEKFVPDPFSPVAGARMYRSGDRVRRRSDGVLDFIGRVDFQVKIRGFRIEPGEVEAALRACPGVSDAVVVACEDALGDARLAAYVAPPGAGPAAALRAHLRERLPEYMVPAAFVLLPALPLTAQGKVDRRALPAPDAAAPGGAAFVAPRTPVEEVLAGIWSEVLGVERVEPHDDFFALGGHSLRVLRVVGAVRGAFGVTLSLRDLFDLPTLAALAAHIAGAAAGGDAAPPLVPVPRDAPLPLSFAQARLWFLQALEPESATYNMPFPLRLRGRLDAKALARSLTALAARHEVLRTRFERRADGPVQVAEPPAPVVLPRVDLSGLPPAAREARLRALARGEAARPFDLSRAPLFRATLVRMAADDHALLFTLHHVAGDGWSLEVLVREVSALYAAFAAGAVPGLPPLPVQYADYAAWQRGWLRGEVLERQLDWWRRALAGAPPALELPTDFPHPEHPRDLAGLVSRDLPQGAAEALEAVARRESATAYMTLLALFAVHLFRASGQEDLVVGAPTANRTRPEVRGLIGFFVNLLPLRLRLGGNPTFRAVLRQVRETALAAYTHAEVPFETVVQELDVERVPGRRTLVQVALTTDAFDHAPLAFPGVSAELESFVEHRTKFDLELNVGTRADGEPRASLLYDASLFRAETAEALLDDFLALLAQAAEAPDRRILDFVLEGEDEPVEAQAGAGADEHDFAF